MNRLFPVILVALIVLFSSCNNLELGTNTSSSVYITSFTFRQTDNSTVLSSDIHATIDNNTNIISFIVPYKVVDTGTSLTPLVTTTTGATLSPSGPQLFSTLVSPKYVVSDGTSSRSYKTQLIVDPLSICYLSVASPFYLDSTNAPHAAAACSVNISTPLTVNLQLTNGLYASYSSAKIGYYSVSYPANALISSDDYLKLHSGATMPYSITITSPDRSYSKLYTFTVSNIGGSAAIITGFTLTKANNPSLTNDVAATIDSLIGKINFAIPSNLLNTPLTPTITVSTGATITPAGPQIFSAPISYIVINANGTLVSQYSTNATSTAGTNISLSVSDPFYCNTSGTLVPLTGFVVDSTSNPGTTTLILDPNTYNQIHTLPIGYSTVVYASDATIPASQLLYLKSGSTMPYSVTVTSPDGTLSKTYDFTITQQIPIDNNIASITAISKHQELNTTTHIIDNSTAIATLNNTYLPIVINDPGLDYYITTGTTYTPLFIPADTINNLGSYYMQGTSPINLTTPLQSFPSIANLIPASSLIANTWTSTPVVLAPNGAVYTRSETVSETSFSNSNYAAALYLSGGSHYTSSVSYSAVLIDDGSIPLTLNYSNTNFPFNPSASVNTPGSTQSLSSTISATFSAAFSNTLLSTGYNTTSQSIYVVIPSSSTGSQQTGPLTSGSMAQYIISSPSSITTSSNASVTLSFPCSDQTTSSPQGSYHLLYSISIIKSNSSTSFTNIIPSHSLISSQVISGNTLTFTLVDPGTPSVNQSTGAFTFVPKQTGIVASFSISTAGGSSQNYTLTLQ